MERAMSEPNPFQTLLQIAGGYCLPRCLHVVAELGVADVLEEAPRTAAELGAVLGADPDALGRVLRLLAAHGVFVSQGDRFRHSPMSRLLRTDDPHSLRAFTRMFGLPSWWAIYGSLERAVRTGCPATDDVLPGGLYAHFAAHPEESAVFNAAMVAKAHAQVAGILGAYDFSGFRVVGDIGGGRGHLLRAVLDAVPTARGVLFDLPHVVNDAAGVASERLTLQGGDFFKDDLPVCDAYLVMEVIHAWGDKEGIAILRAIRRASPPNAKVLLIEQMVPDDPGPHWSKMLDIHMMTLLGGRQRTRQEYEGLFESAGFSLQREVDTGAGVSILEAMPA
jgi:hypothetical protein